MGCPWEYAAIIPHLKIEMWGTRRCLMFELPIAIVQPFAAVDEVFVLKDGLLNGLLEAIDLGRSKAIELFRIRRLIFKRLVSYSNAFFAGKVGGGIAVLVIETVSRAAIEHRIRVL